MLSLTEILLILNVMMKHSSEDMPTSGKSRRKTGGATSGRLPHHLPNFMADVAVYFHNVPDDRTRKLSRYLVAYPFWMTEAEMFISSSSRPEDESH